VSNHGFAFLADTTDRVIFDLCQSNPQQWTVETWDSSVTLNIYDGPQPATAVERLTADTGRQPLASDVVLAPWNDAIFGSANVRKIASELRAAHIPSGVIWTEDFRGGSFNGDNYQLSREWDVDRTLYPDIEQLAADLHSEGFRFFAYFNTFVDSGTNIINDARSANVLIQQKNGSEYDFLDPFQIPTSMVDLTNAAGVSFVQSWLRKFEGYGFDGWMADYGEWLPADAKLRGGEDPIAYHNIYPRTYHAAALGALHSLPNQDTSVSFVRSGTIRDAPFQPVVWGGDQLTTFATDDGFPTALMKGLNLGLAGIAIYGSDIAGYQNDIAAPSTKELFFRWTTLGALSPVMRTHHGVKAALDWSFASDSDSTAHFARWSQFHAQLWPYLKGAAQQAFEHGMPIMRVLALGWPADDTVWPITDEYLFGPSILVAPVLAQGATNRNVYLPAGTWLPMWSGEPLEGPMQITAELPTTEIGLYVLAGAIIPMLPGGFDTLMSADPPLVTLDAVRNNRVLKVFGGANGQVTDLDGTQYVLRSATTDPVVEVQVGGLPLPSCEGSTTPCADIDATNRLVTVVGSSLTSLELVTSGGATSTLTISGMLSVGEVDYRF
jgi:alpha-glucosidase